MYLTCVNLVFSFQDTWLLAIKPGIDKIVEFNTIVFVYSKTVQLFHLEECCFLNYRLSEALAKWNVFMLYQLKQIAALPGALENDWLNVD